ncbi:uncharacterized protein N7506_005822 [Penicillium brevicompactum]|uniref:uncharacterized protein n=1 Tax=Penicillium brevicompactum TaxID=5074 RepID=UPI002540993A|nr:uncharacterized protein N7506_005822 [Penicillium brevicompactum]KAJ5332039.1 hypothetical protein N7506_005822 [Penicillium brevicompactum]
MASDDYYPYTPSLIAAVIGVGLYFALFAVHFVRIYHTRAWDGTYMLAGALMQAMGLGARVYSSKDPSSFGAHGAQYVLLLLGPTLCMFTVNVTQVKMMRCLNSENLGAIPVPLRLPTYLIINTALLLLQMVGSVILAVTHRVALLETATKILTASYVCQMVFWLSVLGDSIIWRIRFGRSPSSNPPRMAHWKYYAQLFDLAISIVALGRSLMRLTQLGMGPEGFLTVTEWPNYAFDFYQPAVILLAWGVFYLPGICREIAFKNVSDIAR